MQASVWVHDGGKDEVPCCKCHGIFCELLVSSVSTYTYILEVIPNFPFVYNPFVEEDDART